MTGPPARPRSERAAPAASGEASGVVAGAPSAVRNVGILAHIDAGKTTVTEHLLHRVGMIRRVGRVEDGSTVTDWTRQEQERGITVGSACVSFRAGDVEVNLVDTPGHVDFTVEVERCLTVLDGVIVVLSGPDGVQPQTQTVWHQAARRQLPAIGFVNKLDRPGYDGEALHQQIRDRLGIEPVAMQVPIAHGEDGLVLLDVLAQVLVRFPAAADGAVGPPEFLPLDPDSEAMAREAREQLVDAIASSDDAFAELVLEGEEPSSEQWLAALRRAVLTRACLPLFHGSAKSGAGLGRLAQAIVELLPAPEDVPRHRAYDLETGETAEHVTRGAGVPAAFVFKTEVRAPDERVVWVRVFEGELHPGDPICRLPEGEDYTVGQLMQLQGGLGRPVAALTAGAIGGIVHGVGDPVPSTGDTLATVGFGQVFERVHVPSPVIGLALEAHDLEGHAAMRDALEALVHDDPSLAVDVDPATGQTLLRGMGELHLELAVERLQERLRGGAPGADAAEPQEIAVGAPRVERRALPAKDVEARGRWDADGGPGGHVLVTLRLERRPRSLGADVHWLEAPPRRRELREALEAGVSAALAAHGALGDVAGLRVAGADVWIVDMRCSSSEAPPVAFYEAARRATAEAVRDSEPVAAEPWMALTVVAPEETVGRVAGDLARRRARIKGSESRGQAGHLQALHAEAPLAEMLAYATDLRSLTAGRGVFTMEPLGFEPVAAP